MAVEKDIKALQAELGLLENQKSTLGETADILEKIREKNIEIAEQKQKDHQKELQLLRELKDLAEGAGEPYDDIVDKINQVTGALADAIRETDGLKEAGKQAKAGMDELAKSMAQGKKLGNLLGLDESQKDSLTYRLAKDPKGVFEGLKSQANSFGGVGGAVLTSLTMKLQEASAALIKLAISGFKQFDNALASFNKATGAAGRYDESLIKISRTNVQFGISAQEASKAMATLYENLFTFTQLSEEAVEAISLSVAKLDQISISSDQSTTFISSLSQAMQVTELQASKTTDEISGLGVAIGRTGKKITEDLSLANDRLFIYGDRMVDILKDLQAQAQATGVSITDITTVSEKFLTFEGAANAAGRINAIFGGNIINTMELLEAAADNPAKAIDLLRTRLDEAGISFNELNIFEKKYVAESAGFKSVQEAQRLLSGTNAEREKELKLKQQTADAQKALDEAIKASLPVQEQLAKIFQNIAFFSYPFLKFIRETTDSFAKFTDGMSDGTKTFITFGAIVAAGLLTIVPAAFAFSKAAAVVTTASGALPAAGTAAGTGLAALGSGAAVAAGPLAAIGLSILAIGGAFFLFYKGVTSVIDSLKGLLGVVSVDLIKSLEALVTSLGVFTNPLNAVRIGSFANSIRQIVSAVNELDMDRSINFRVITENIGKYATVSPSSTEQIGMVKQTNDMIAAINGFSLSNQQAENLNKLLQSLKQVENNTTSSTQPTESKDIMIDVYIGSEKLNDVVTKIVDKRVTGNIGGFATSLAASPVGPRR
jgi:hypothetical protein